MDILILSIISFITTIVGLYYIGEKSPFGFIWFTCSLMCQLYIFYEMKNWFLVLQMAVLIAFNLFNFKKWIREDV